MKTEAVSFIWFLNRLQGLLTQVTLPAPRQAFKRRVRGRYKIDARERAGNWSAKRKEGGGGDVKEKKKGAPRSPSQVSRATGDEAKAWEREWPTARSCTQTQRTRCVDYVTVMSLVWKTRHGSNMWCKKKKWLLVNLCLHYSKAFCAWRSN